jgi:hypothetical protein
MGNFAEIQTHFSGIEEKSTTKSYINLDWVLDVSEFERVVRPSFGLSLVVRGQSQAVLAFFPARKDRDEWLEKNIRGAKNV